MADLFATAGAALPTARRGRAPAPAPAPAHASVSAPDPTPRFTGPTPEAPLPPSPQGAIAWPHRWPTPAELADPAFRAVFDAMRPWCIWEPKTRGYGFAAAQHAEIILDALRRAGVLPEAPDAR